MPNNNPTGKGGQKKGEPSRNASGKGAKDKTFRDICRMAADEHVIPAWIRSVIAQDETWLKCGENLVAYGYGKPSESVKLDGQQQIEVVIRTESASTAAAAVDPDAESA